MCASTSDFWNKLFGVEGEADRVWRAGAEAILAATLLVFLFAYLNLNRWHVRASHVAAVWLAFLVALVALAVYDAPVAAGVARISLAAIAGAGFALVLYLALHGVERAVMLIPTWFLLLLWLTAAGFTVTGTLHHDLVAPALIGGLVLIVMLIGFTVMQNAFAGSGPLPWRGVGRRAPALALIGSGDVVFDWDVSADRIYVSPEAEQSLGLNAARWKAPPPAGSKPCIPSIATATRPASTRCSSSGAGASTSTSACAPQTVTTSGISSRPARSSAPTAK